MKRLIRRAIWLLICVSALPGAASAAEGPLRWFGGDCNVPVWPNGSVTLRERARQAQAGGLNWYAVTTPVTSRTLTEPGALGRTAGLDGPGPEPLLALRWLQPTTIARDIVCLGLDLDLPLPEPRPAEIITWADRVGGFTILSGPATDPAHYARPLPGLHAFEAFSRGQWSPACSLDGAWDQLLTRGHRLFIVGGSDDPEGTALGDGAVTTHVLAESNAPRDIIAALRSGRAVVAERNKVRLDFTVNGAPPGSVVRAEENKVEVALSVRARQPVDEVKIIGNIRFQGTGGPGSGAQVLHRVELGGRLDIPPFELAVSRATVYLRAEAITRDGGYRTLTNPVFLGDPESETSPADPLQEGIDLVGATLDLLDWEDEPELARDVTERILADGRVGLYAVYYLARNPDRAALEQVARLVQTGRARAQTMAAAVLVKVYGADALPLIGPILDTDNQEARLYVGRMLARYAGPAHQQWVMRAARDHTSEVRQYGAAALARLTDVESLLLLRALLSDWSEQVRRTATVELAHAADIAPSAVDRFIEQFKAGDIDRSIVQAAVRNPRLRWTLEEAADRPVPRIALTEPRRRRQPDAVRGLVARRVPRGPIIDGTGRDPAWAAAQPLGDFTLEEGEEPRYQTFVRAVYDDNALYLLFQCHEPEIHRMLTLYTERGSSVWLDDSIEMFLSPPTEEGEDQRLYFRLAANTRGAQFDKRLQNPRWNTVWNAAASRRAGWWVLEVRLPFRSFPLPRPTGREETTWRVNFVRNRRILPVENTYFQWGDPREPATNAVLSFE